MPRSIATYSAAEWLRLRPFQHSYKTWLWNRIDRRFIAAPALEPSALSALINRCKGQNLIVSIAWNAPWTTKWQLRFVQRNLVNARFLVADNSTRDDARAEIKRLCLDTGFDYLALPPNPYRTTRHASRSHGLALNWVYHNVICQVTPRAWGFFDHDLFPTAAFDPALRLHGQPFYGDLVERTHGAYLWPGFCLFAANADDRVRLDFRQDWFVGLDTGGMNGSILFDKVDLAAMHFAQRRSIGPQRNFAVTNDDIDWFDDCVHLGNASGWLAPHGEREPALDQLLERIYEGELMSPFGASHVG